MGKNHYVLVTNDDFHVAQLVEHCTSSANVVGLISHSVNKRTGIYCIFYCNLLYTVDALYSKLPCINVSTTNYFI